jgi:hypothetical protein
MGGIYKLSSMPVDGLDSGKKKSKDEFLSTPEKKLKYKVLSKEMATKLAFKNLKK